MLIATFWVKLLPPARISTVCSGHFRNTNPVYTYLLLAHLLDSRIIEVGLGRARKQKHASKIETNLLRSCANIVYFMYQQIIAEYSYKPY